VSAFALLCITGNADSSASARVGGRRGRDGHRDAVVCVRGDGGGGVGRSSANIQLGGGGINNTTGATAGGMRRRGRRRGGGSKKRLKESLHLAEVGFHVGFTTTTVSQVGHVRGREERIPRLGGLAPCLEAGEGRRRRVQEKTVAAAREKGCPWVRSGGSLGVPPNAHGRAEVGNIFLAQR